MTSSMPIVAEVLQPGVQTSVQDGGRPGWRHWGVAAGGALDAPALARCNLLLGNAPGCAGLEVVLGPMALRLRGNGWLAITGADFGAELSGRRLSPEYRTSFEDGQVLTLGAQPQQGARAYIVLAGGFQVPDVLGAKATDLQSGFGGHGGRALRKGDRLPVLSGLPLHRRVGLAPVAPQLLLRALPGPDIAAFTPLAQAAFWQGEWALSAQSNRMGARLQGAAIAKPALGEMLSHAVLPGVVQVPPDGQPIVLLADAQTTGGYPRIAVVIQADLWKLAQTRVGQSVHFQAVNLEEAQAAASQAQAELATLRRSISLFA